MRRGEAGPVGHHHEGRDTVHRSGKIVQYFVPDPQRISNGPEVNVEHILLAHALIFDRGEAKLEPPGCVYDVRTGTWVFRDSGEQVVSQEPQRPPESKKIDVEAAEDPKGD